MDHTLIRSFCIVVIYLAQISHSSPQPLQLPFSTKGFGPDGPWPAVEVSIGSNEQNISLLPTFQPVGTTVLRSGFCDNTSYVACDPSGGLYNPLTSTTARAEGNSSYAVFWGNVASMQSSSQIVYDQVQLGSNTIPQMGLDVWHWADMEYFQNEWNYPPTLGAIQLGYQRKFSNLDADDPPTGLSQVPINYLYNQSIIPSPSFSLHYGSVVANVPGSLWLGGYDKSRVIGDVARFTGSHTEFANLVFNVRAIGIETAYGEPPLPSTRIEYPTFSAQISMVYPYLQLPAYTCERITKDLPVKISHSFYAWNTDDAEYEKIVASPAYLYFEVEFENSDKVVKIKIPFSMLNLTLEKPVQNPPIQYFPCSTPYEPLINGAWTLGRPLYQAMFLAINFDYDNSEYEWFVAQAPGPNVQAPDVVSLQRSNLKIQASDQTWESTWEGHWKPILPDNFTNHSSSRTSNESTDGTGLSVAARDAIIVSVSIIAAVILTVGIILVYRRHYRSGQSKQTIQTQAPTAVYEKAELVQLDVHEGPRHELDPTQYPLGVPERPNEPDGRMLPSELPTREQRVELPT